MVHDHLLPHTIKMFRLSRRPRQRVAKADQIGDTLLYCNWSEEYWCRRDLCWNLIGAVSSRVRILGQAARSIGLSASFWVSVCHPSTLRMVI